MHRLLTLVLMLATAMVIAVDNVSLEAQTAAAGPAPAFAASITLEKDIVPLGQSPWADLTVKNLTDREITIDARPHVVGEKGELPLQAYAQIITESLQPRVPRLKTVLYVPWVIPPGETSTHKYKLAHFFDLSNRGQYTVYMDAGDSSSQTSVRTNSAKFEMQALTH